MIVDSCPGWGWEFFSSLPPPDRLWSPPSFPSNGYQGLFPWGWRGRGPKADHSPPSSTEVKECVELYLHSPSMPSGSSDQLKKAQGQLYIYLIIQNYPTIRRNVIKESNIRGYIQKFPDWVDNIIYAYNNKYSLRTTKSVMAAKPTRLTHKIAIKLPLVAERCTICSFRSRRPVRKLLDTPSCYKRLAVSKISALYQLLSRLPRNPLWNLTARHRHYENSVFYPARSTLHLHNLLL